MNRLPSLLLAVAFVLFVAGVATSSTAVLMLGVAVAVGMLVSLLREDLRNSKEAKDAAAPVTSGATPTAVEVDATVDAAAPATVEADEPVVVITKAPAKAATAKASKPAAKAVPKKRAVSKPAAVKAKSNGTAKAKATNGTKSNGTAKTNGAKSNGKLAKVDVAELLRQVEGVGPAKLEKLTKAFPTAEALRAASTDDLVKVDGVGPALAKKITAGVK